MCMCIDLPVYHGKTILGHDGMEKLWPSLEEPYCYRGYTYPEVIMLAYLKGFSAVYHEFVGMFSPYHNITPKQLRLPEVYREHILKHSTGIITLEQGNTFHAVAFCDSIIYDPRGNSYLLPLAQYQNVQACITVEPRPAACVTSHDINTLMAIQRA